MTYTRDELPPVELAEIGPDRYERLKLFWAVLSFPLALIARLAAAGRASQRAAVERARRAGLSAID
jgi:hypothetical protein